MADDAAVTTVLPVFAAVVATTLVLGLVASAVGAAPRPDGHDRALAARLDAEVTTFKQVVARSHGDSRLQSSLDPCAFAKKDPSQAFAAAFALLPVLRIEVVNDYRPQLTALRDTLGGMRADSALFQQWLDAEKNDFALILEFDNHGKKIDVCKAASVLVDKNSSATYVQRALGIDPTLIAKAFSSPLSATLTKLNPKMRPFLIAAGLPRKHAAALTSN